MKILAVAVAVEILVRIVKNDGFAVLGRQLIIARGRQRLAERGAIFERKPGLAQGVAKTSPRLAAASFVALIDKNKIITLERLYRDADPAAAPDLMP